MSTKTAPNYWRLKNPCKRCPFRSDIDPYLTGGRAQEIAQALLDGSTFTCHTTTVPDDDDEDGASMMDGPNAAMCAGATATMLAGNQSNQIMRIAERVGVFDAEKVLASTVPVYDNLAAWVAANRGDDDATVLEHCDVVGPDCEDPPGFMTGAGASHNLNPGTVDPEDESRHCSNCGNGMCDGCLANAREGEYGLECEDCADEDEEEEE